MIRKEIMVVNERGLHGRPGVKLVKCSQRFDSNITLGFCGKTARSRDMLSIMMLGAGQGAIVTVVANGEDEIGAMAAIDDMITHGLEGCSEPHSASSG